MDQVAWANANITVAGETTPFSRGALLPEPTSPEESAERSTLRLIGAVRTVEVVYTPDELAEQARLRGTASAAREASLDVDPSAPLGQQVPGSAEAGPPTMVEPSGSPVVIGDEDLKAEHEKANQAARDKAAQAAQDKAAQPSAAASKQAWVDHAVDVHGADRDEAQGMTRDQLRDRYSQADTGGQMAAGPPLAADLAAQAQQADDQARQQAAGQQQQQAAQQQQDAAQQQQEAAQQQQQAAKQQGAAQRGKPASG
jgi:hypothetical protein